MSHVIGCPVSQDELFNELGCGGGATLFIDNIDQVDDAGAWATISDLLGGVHRSPGWRAVTTGGIGNDEWKVRLPPELRKGGIATLSVGELSDAETETLAGENRALAIILGKDHPARGIARNLFYLSRMIELGANQGGDAASIATEMDLARLWWRYGAGRSEDDRLFARKKMLRAMGARFIADPRLVLFKADGFESSTIVELLRFDSLREDIKGATVAFRHDVLRDWAIAFLLHEDSDLLRNLPVERPLPVGLARGIEITARLAIEADATGARWLALLNAVQGEGSHGSWRRPVLLALPRADRALGLLENLKPVLLANDGRLLGEIIQLMISVETVPLAKLLKDAQSSIELPAGASDLVVPTGSGWMWLMIWLVSVGKSLPTALIPNASKVFQSWLIATQHQRLGINALVVESFLNGLLSSKNGCHLGLCMDLRTQAQVCALLMRGIHAIKSE